MFTVDSGRSRSCWKILQIARGFEVSRTLSQFLHVTKSSHPNYEMYNAVLSLFAHFFNLTVLDHSTALICVLYDLLAILVVGLEQCFIPRRSRMNYQIHLSDNKISTLSQNLSTTSIKYSRNFTDYVFSASRLPGTHHLF